MQPKDARMIEQIRKRQEQSAVQESTDMIGSVFGSMMMYFGLRGFWPYSVRGASGLLRDMSHNNMDLTMSGAVTFTQVGRVPYATYNGANYHYRLDEAFLDITGNITFGGWFYITDLTATRYLISKFDAPTNNRSYVLLVDTAGSAQVIVSTNGTATIGNFNVVASPPGSVVVNRWTYIVGRLFAGLELDVIVNDTLTANTSSIIPSIFNSTASLMIGGVNNTAPSLIGNATLCFLAEAVGFSTLQSVYRASRVFLSV